MKTTNEMLRKEFLDAISGYVEYWGKQKCDSNTKLKGLAHSILVTMDGCSGANCFRKYDISYNGFSINDNVELHDLIEFI